MRNIFDQYSQPENRISHALAVCLNEDRSLLRGFLKCIKIKKHPPIQRLRIVEQSLPGEQSLDEPEKEEHGLPDIIIHDNESWCVLIENKVMARLGANQLQRHQRTLERRGFTSISIVALTKSNGQLPPNVFGLQWTDLYQWLGRGSQTGEWVKRLRHYLEVAEVRFARDGYLTEGTLTMFDGFRFADGQYTYGEAKRLLKLAVAELRDSSKLRALGVDAGAKGRGAITGSQGNVVWDILQLRGGNAQFTSYPHLTLDVAESYAATAITIPHVVDRRVFSRLSRLSGDEFVKLNREILQKGRKLIRKGAEFRCYAVQRHFLHRRGGGHNDGYVKFRLETSQPKGSKKVKHQPQWCDLLVSLIGKKRSNLQFGYTVDLPYGMEGMTSRESLTIIEDSWCAMEPLLDRLLHD